MLNLGSAEEFEQKMEGKKRKVVFSIEDQLLLLDLIFVERETIENKITNKHTNNEKDKAWQRITSKFNSSALLQRNVDQLKSKFDNLKTRVRKVVAEQKDSSRGTGGGASTKNNYDPVVESTLRILNSKTVFGLHSPLDFDTVEKVEMASVPDPNNSVMDVSPVQIDHSPMESSKEVVQEEPHKTESENWSSYKSRKLKRPVRKSLRTQDRNPLSVAKKDYYKKKKEVLENEDKRRENEYKRRENDDKRRENEDKRNQEEHDLKMKLLKLQVLELQTKLNVEP